MSFPDPQGTGPRPARRWALGVGLVVAMIVIAVVVVIIVDSGSSNRPERISEAQGATSATPGSTASTASTATASVAAPHPLSTTTASATTSPSRAASALSPPGGPVPTGFEPGSFTAISHSIWWLMGNAPCASAPCTSIVRTVNGGRSFVGIPAPRTSEVTNLRFADARNGFAYGQELWSTHDGGASWNQVTVAGEIRDLAISGGDVWVSTTKGLLRARADGDGFSVVHAGDFATVWAQGAEVLADEITSTGNRLLSSGNRGGRFTAYPAPAATVACAFATTGGAVIWAQCATGTLGAVWRSVDAGARWSAVGPKGDASAADEQPNGAAFAAASGETAVYGDAAVFHTTDGGAEWSPASGLGLPDTSVGYLGFTDETHGVALVQSTKGESSEKLEVTTDGGARYTPVPIAGG